MQVDGGASVELVVLKRVSASKLLCVDPDSRRLLVTVPCTPAATLQARNAVRALRYCRDKGVRGVQELAWTGALSDGAECLATMWIDGQSLWDFVLSGGRASDSQANEWFHALSGRLTDLHEAGILHRDVSPANIIVLPDGSDVRLIDLGLAHWSVPGAPNLPVLGACPALFRSRTLGPTLTPEYDFDSLRLCCHFATLGLRAYCQVRKVCDLAREPVGRLQRVK